MVPGADSRDSMVILEADALVDFPRFTLYNSPYTAHRQGRAIDLYPGTEMAPSPVTGRVRETKTTACPSRPYAADHDHLIVIDTGTRLARILHVEPSVEAGEAVERGDPLGRLIRSGYFAPWVDNHVHLGFREYGADPIRASGSLRLGVDAEIRGVQWDGSGTVVESGETYAILDVPTHPDPGAFYVGITDDSGRFVLDGGLPHYSNGGVFPLEPVQAAGEAARTPDGGAVPTQLELLGTRLGPPEGREVPWESIEVVANGDRILGLSFVLGREAMYAKLICPDADFAVGDQIEVTLVGP